MKMLITGAAGFIGGHIARQLQPAWDVRTEPPQGQARRAITEASLLDVMRGELPDAIVHAAGSGTVARVTAAPAHEMTANLSALVSLFEYAVKQAPDTHVVLLSSAALYGNGPPAPQREDQGRAPVSFYGLLKAQSEGLGAYYAAQHDLRVTAVRLFSVYGDGLRKQLLWDAMNKFAAGRHDFFGTGQEQRDWIHVDDVVRFVRVLVATPGRPGFQVINCAGGQAVSNAQVLSRLAEVAGAPAPVFNGQSRPGDPVCLVADCALAHRLLPGWQAQTGWYEGVARYARWFAEHGVAGRGAAG